MANKTRVREVIGRIKADPAGFDMDTWVGIRYDDDNNVCGTTLCVGGHAAVASGAVIRRDEDGGDLWFYRDDARVSPSTEAVEYLGLSEDELYCDNGDYLFATDPDAAMVHLEKLAA